MGCKMINQELKKYIEEKILPENEKNEAGHNMLHINYVIRRSFKFAKSIENINENMVYVIAAFHDVGHHIDAKNHEKVSAKILENDSNLKKFFTDEEIKIMKEAVEDHRASNSQEPRSIYGKIISSADRNTEMTHPLTSTYSYCLEHNQGSTLEEIIEISRQHLIDKYCQGGYAVKKMYFKDKEFENHLKEINSLCQNKELFRKKYLEMNNLDINSLEIDDLEK